MHAGTILRKFLADACPQMHAGRREAVAATVSSALRGSSLTVTALGRGLSSEGSEKHHIKRIDRLLSNRYLHDETAVLYAALARRLLAGATRPLISVDWSNLDLAKRHYLLRASLSVEGRAMTLYEEVHPRHRFQKATTERRFLRRLDAVLGSAVRPIVLTDAGFRNPWFNAVRAMGWDFIGRVRGRVMLASAGEHAWVQARTLFAQATTRPSSLPLSRLSRDQPMQCRFALVKSPSRRRHQLNRDGRRSRCEHANRHSRANREPWLLATSLDIDKRTALRRVVDAYATRMQIEEAFRDLKSVHFGLGFETSRSVTLERIAVLMLVALLATFIAWLLGACAEAAGQHRRYQANTVTSRRVLSYVFLGRRIAKHRGEPYLQSDFNNALQHLRSLVQRHARGF